MPSAIEHPVIKAGDLISSAFSTRDKVLVSVKSNQPCKVRVLGMMTEDEGDTYLPLSVQDGPPPCEIDLTEGIVLFSVAYMQGVMWMEFELVDAHTRNEDIIFTVFLRSFPND